MIPDDVRFQTPILTKIWVYPIKSLDGVSVSASQVTAGGALASDREFALVDSAGRFVNAKRKAKIHQVRSQFDLSQRTVTLTAPNFPTQSFDLDRDRAALSDWLSEFFGETVMLKQNTTHGFPDDLKASGPTVISEATLSTVAGWFPAMTVEELRSRLRTNLEISGVPAFWEDCLFTPPLKAAGFCVGAIALQGCNPCQRCVVPTRHPETGAITDSFQKTLAQQRQSLLPDWVDPAPFNHYYRLAVNTLMLNPSIHATMRVGDRLVLNA